METGSVSRIPLQLARNCVVASIQIDLSEEVLRQFRSDLLELLHSSGAGGVILDVSGVDVLDLEDFEAIKRTMEMAALMGARTVVSGLRPGVVSALVELDADTDGIVAALNLDEAFRAMDELNSATEPPESEAERVELLDSEDDEEDESGQNGPFTSSF